MLSPGHVVNSLAPRVVGARSWLAALAVGSVSLVVLPGWREPLVVVLAVAGAVAAYAASRHLVPLMVVGVVSLGLAGVWPAAFLASYLLALRGSHAMTAAWAVTSAAVAVARALLQDPSSPGVGLRDASASMVTFLVVPLVLGWWVRERGRVMAGLREQAERLERERDAVVARERAEERARIATEMHDVVAHKVSLMVIHAGAIDMQTADPGTRNEAQLVQDLGRQAMSNLRDVLTVLRDDSEVTPSTRPTPGLADLDELIEHSRCAGLTVVRQEQGTPETVSQAVGAAVYRVVQEALTNVHRHARDASVEVRFGWSPQAVDVTIHDRPRDGQRPALPSSGLGLVGLRERVAALGGTLAAGPVGGDYRVSAHLPLEARGEAEGDT